MLSLQTITLLALAVLPGLFLTTYVYQRDTVDAEPVGLLWSLVLLGALSALPASLLEGALEPLLRSVFRPNTALYYALMSFLVVAVSEEACKFVMLRLRTWRHPAFDYRFDGIVYGVMVAVGFATLENILYVLQNGFGTGVARALLSVPGHVSWGVLMGYYYGRAKAFEVAGDQRQARGNLTRALVVPTLFHGVYDTCAFINGPMMLILICVAVFGDVLMVYLVRRESTNDAAFWRPMAQVGFQGYTAVQTGVPVRQVAYQQRYAQGGGYFPQAQGAPSYQVPQPQAAQQQWPQQAGAAPQAGSAPQQAGYQRGYQRSPYQAPASGQAPATYWQASAQAYQRDFAPQHPQPYGAPATRPTPFSWLKYMGLRILGYLGVMLGLFAADVFLAVIGIEGIVDEFLIYLIVLMVILAVPYLAIIAFAGGLKKRRVSRGLA